MLDHAHDIKVSTVSLIRCYVSPFFTHFGKWLYHLLSTTVSPEIKCMFLLISTVVRCFPVIKLINTGQCVGTPISSYSIF